MPLVPRAATSICGLANSRIGMRRSDYSPPVTRAFRRVHVRILEVVAREGGWTVKTESPLVGVPPDPYGYRSHVAQP
jgi:hypothetical protein